jgi:GH24 family phage-related lysozyme (muramidase)
LTIQRTQTGYWTVHRGATQVAAAMTRRGAEAERELLRRLSRRSVRRAGRVRV